MSKWKYISQGLKVSYSEFFGHSSIYSDCVLKGTEEPPLWLGDLSVKCLEFEVSRLT